MNIITFESINSTNLYAKENIDSLTDKTVISANNQTNGYGRFERKWVDLGEENIYMTFVLKPSEELRLEYANLTQYLSVCLCQLIEHMPQPSVVTPKIKWPNDVLINGNKVCGILAESVVRSGKLKGLVLGIGVNLNASTQDLGEIDRPATALNLEFGYKFDKQKFIEDLVKQFFENYDMFLKDGFSFIKENYEQRSIFSLTESSQNDLIKVAVFNKVKEGFFAGFDNNGNFLLKSQNGEIENINMGEII